MHVQNMPSSETKGTEIPQFELTLVLVMITDVHNKHLFEVYFDKGQA